MSRVSENLSGTSRKWTRHAAPPLRMAVMCSAALLAGCAGEGDAGAKARPDADTRQASPLAGLDRAERTVAEPRPGVAAAGADSRPPVAVGGELIPWSDLQPLMAEAAGGLVIEEVALGRALRREMGRKGLTLTTEEVQAERGLLAGSLTRGAGAKPEDVDRLVASVRRARGLGDTGFALRGARNAMLRRLVRDDVVVTDEIIDQNFAIMYGPKVKVRVIVTPTQSEARDAFVSIQGKAPDDARPAAGADVGPPQPPDPGLPARFGEVAARVSTDESASRGGMIEPFSPDDPAYPAAVRSAAAATAAGRLSDVFALGNGYGLLLVDEKMSGADVRLGDVIDAYDPALRWSWDQRAGKAP
jgi:hypothetical protein